MKPGTVIVREVTGDPEAEARVQDRAPEMRQALLDLGFTSLGLIELRSPGAMTVEQARQVMAGPDAELMIAALEKGDVDEILAAPDGTAVATVEAFFGGPVLSLRTLAHNGSVVETTQDPIWRPAPAAPPPGTAPLVERLAAGLTSRATAGDLPVWPRENRPQAGYHVELVERAGPEALWAAHRRRVEDLLPASHTGVEAHDDLTASLGISCRSWQIMEYVGRAQMLVMLGLVALALLAVAW